MQCVLKKFEPTRQLENKRTSISPEWQVSSIWIVSESHVVKKWGKQKSSKKLAQDPREAAGPSVDLDRFIFTALTVYLAPQFIFHSKGMLMPDFELLQHHQKIKFKRMGHIEGFANQKHTSFSHSCLWSYVIKILLPFTVVCLKLIRNRICSFVSPLCPVALQL